MIQYTKVILMLLMFLCIGYSSTCQLTPDSIPKSSNVKSKKSSDSIKKFNPRVATLRSAILPGWGQIYNKKFWKLGIIYPALGITAGVFFYNLKTYKELRQAFIYKSDTIPSNDVLISEKLTGLSAESLRTYRNQFRQNIDYTVLVFIIFWGLNVVDATVDAHLKAFDVSDNISLRLKPGYNPVTNNSGLALVFSIKDKPTRKSAFLPNY